MTGKREKGLTLICKLHLIQYLKNIRSGKINYDNWNIEIELSKTVHIKLNIYTQGCIILIKGFANSDRYIDGFEPVLIFHFYSAVSME